MGFAKICLEYGSPGQPRARQQYSAQVELSTHVKNTVKHYVEVKVQKKTKNIQFCDGWKIGCAKGNLCKSRAVGLKSASMYPEWQANTHNPKPLTHK